MPILIDLLGFGLLFLFLSRVLRAGGGRRRRLGFGLLWRDLICSLT